MCNSSYYIVSENNHCSEIRMCNSSYYIVYENNDSKSYVLHYLTVIAHNYIFLFLILQKMCVCAFFNADIL